MVEFEPEGSMSDLEHVMELVTGALDRAGIAWGFDFKRSDEAYAHIMIEVGEDGRGVYIDWELARRDSEPALAAVNAKRYSDPSISRGHDLFQAANARIEQALHVAGIAVIEFDEVYHPGVLKVVNVPKEPQPPSGQ